MLACLLALATGCDSESGPPPSDFGVADTSSMPLDAAVDGSADALAADVWMPDSTADERGLDVGGDAVVVPDSALPDSMPADVSRPDMPPPDAGECSPGETRPCGLEEGMCVPGLEQCDEIQRWGPCRGAVGPTDETCDGLDNDCDGLVDEGYVPLGCGVGVCGEFAVWSRCEDGVETECVPGEPRAETCDGADDDCDGSVDEAFPSLGEPCELDRDNCQLEGRVACAGPAQVACAAPDEVCNGQDDDCDGYVDETLVGVRWPPMVLPEGELNLQNYALAVLGDRAVVTIGQYEA